MTESSNINAVLEAIEGNKPEEAQRLIMSLTPLERKRLEPLLAAKEAYYREQEEFCARQIELARCVADALESTGAKNLNEILDHPDLYREAFDTLGAKVLSLGFGGPVIPDAVPEEWE